VLGSQTMQVAQSPRLDGVVHGAPTDRTTSPCTGLCAHTELRNRQMLSNRTGMGPRSHTPLPNRHVPRYMTTSPRGPATLGPNGGSIQWILRFYWRRSKVPLLHPLRRRLPFSDALTASRPPSHTDRRAVASVLSQQFSGGFEAHRPSLDLWHGQRGFQQVSTHIHPHYRFLSTSM
jgi:hypothetical protein